MNKIILLLITIIILSKIAISAIVSCEGKCSISDLMATIRNIIDKFLVFGYLMAILLATVGALFIMFGGATQKSYAKGKEMIQKAIIGYIIILASGVIIDMVLEVFQPKLAG